MIHNSVYQLLILSLYYSRARFSKRSSSPTLQEVERGATGGGERGALPGGPLNISEEVAMASSQDDPTDHAPLGAEEKVK